MTSEAEIWDLYDVARLKTGELIERGRAFPAGRYHIVVHVCVFGDDGRMLIQQRQEQKETWPALWDFTAGGSALRGESSQRAAEREVREELGLMLDLGEQLPHFTINFPRGFDDFYIVRANPDLNSLALQPEEVQAVRWASHQEVRALLGSEEFVPFKRSIVDLVFESLDSFGGLGKA